MTDRNRNRLKEREDYDRKELTWMKQKLPHLRKIFNLFLFSFLCFVLFLLFNLFISNLIDS